MLLHPSRRSFPLYLTCNSTTRIAGTTDSLFHKTHLTDPIQPAGRKQIPHHLVELHFQYSSNQQLAPIQCRSQLTNPTYSSRWPSEAARHASPSILPTVSVVRRNVMVSCATGLHVVSFILDFSRMMDVVFTPKL